MLLAACLLSLTAHAMDWQQPAEDVLEVLHAPQLPWVWTSPSGEHLLLAEPVEYPPLAHYAAGWLELAGMRVDPDNGGYHASRGATDPYLVAVDDPDAAPIPLPLPDGAELQEVTWTVDGERFALTVETDDHFGLWVGDVSGQLDAIRMTFEGARHALHINLNPFRHPVLLRET